MESITDYCMLYEDPKKQVFTLRTCNDIITNKNPYTLITYASMQKIPKIKFAWYHAYFNITDLMNTLDPENANEYLIMELFPLMKQLNSNKSQNIPRLCLFKKATSNIYKKCSLIEDTSNDGQKAYTLIIGNESYICGSAIELIKIAVAKQCDVIDLFGLNTTFPLCDLSELLNNIDDDMYIENILIPLVNKLNVIAS